MMNWSKPTRENCRSCPMLFLNNVSDYLVMGGGLVMVQFLGTEGLFSMQLRGLAGSKLL